MQCASAEDATAPDNLTPKKIYSLIQQALERNGAILSNQTNKNLCFRGLTISENV